MSRRKLRTRADGERVTFRTFAEPGLFLLLFLEHQPFKALRVAQPRQMQAALPVQMLVQLVKMLVHFRELHPGIRGQHRVDRQPALHHEQQHRRTVLSAG